MTESRLPLIDATFISTGGGLTLLCELISRLDLLEKKAIFLVDKRLQTNSFFDRPNVIFIGGFIEREFFLARHLLRFRKILHFNNIGSIFTRKRGSAVYFHNILYLKSKDVSISLLKKFFFKIGINRSEIIFVQSKLVKDKFLQVFPNASARIAPFFNTTVVNDISKSLELSKKVLDSKFTIIYPSSIAVHKKHDILAKAVLLLQRRGIDLQLFLTVDEDDFEKKQKLFGYDLCKKVINLGKLSHGDTIKYMMISDAVVHPSIYESFGLVLIEAAILNKNVVAPNLEYVHEVVSTDFLYNVEKADSAPEQLCDALERALFKKAGARMKVSDQFNELVSFLFSEH